MKWVGNVRYVVRREMYTRFFGTLEEKDHLRDLSIDGRVI